MQYKVLKLCIPLHRRKRERRFCDLKGRSGKIKKYKKLSRPEGR